MVIHSDQMFCMHTLVQYIDRPFCRLRQINIECSPFLCRCTQSHGSCAGQRHSTFSCLCMQHQMHFLCPAEGALSPAEDPAACVVQGIIIPHQHQWSHPLRCQRSVTKACPCLITCTPTPLFRIQNHLGSVSRKICQRNLSV